MGCGLGVKTPMERLIAEPLVGKRGSDAQPDFNEEVTSRCCAIPQEISSPIALVGGQWVISKQRC